ncbi:unnamed protein product [Lactuca virosa]|uniref:Uncharacterized protein n=1 Tax=Lactuca virosa TaxID=75947 RepID=A0AAU9MKI0_9ASTR|nr:unnamed protein product [Lactuca virosa]
MNYEEVRKSARFKKTKEICKTAVPSLAHRSDEELKILLVEGIFLNQGKTWFCLNKNGEHCEMISAQECFYPIILKPRVTGFYAKEKTRFEKYMNTKVCSDFKIRIRTQYLSPQVTYAINLVFCLYDSDSTNSRLNYILAGETESLSLYLADTRGDGWLTAELYQFTSDNRNVDLEITFKCWNELLVEGIEFQPVEIVSQQILEHQVLEDKREISCIGKQRRNYILFFTKGSLSRSKAKSGFHLTKTGAMSYDTSNSGFEKKKVELALFTRIKI